MANPELDNYVPSREKEIEAVKSVLISADEDYGPSEITPAEVVRRIIRERDALKKQVDELQAANTRLLEERRAVDIHYSVEQFHRVMGVPVLTMPQVPSDERVKLRLRLITEEYFELLESCYAGSQYKYTQLTLRSAYAGISMAIQAQVPNVDLPEFADACADLDYVVEGSRLEFGIDGRPIARAVHESNMTKKGSVVREDGKILKGPDWKPPDVEGELRRQGWRES